jgi:hypothetical protein
VSSQSQSLIIVVVDGKPLGVWDTLSGAATTASPAKRRPGGSQQEDVARTRSTNDDITVSRENKLERDIAPLRVLRANRVGRATVVVTEQPLDDDDIPFGPPTVYTGILNRVFTGDVDSNSDDFRMAELGVTVMSVA